MKSLFALAGLVLVVVALIGVFSYVGSRPGHTNGQASLNEIGFVMTDTGEAAVDATVMTYIDTIRIAPVGPVHVVQVKELSVKLPAAILVSQITGERLIEKGAYCKPLETESTRWICTKVENFSGEVRIAVDATAVFGMRSP